MQSSNPNQSRGSQFLNWLKAMPFFTRSILFLTILLSLVSIFLPSIVTLFTIIPIIFIDNYAIYSIFTFPYCHLSVLHLIFALLAFIPTAYKTERSLGTYRYISFFIVTNALLGLLYVAILYLGAATGLSFFVEAYKFYPCAGLWPIIMTEMVVKCNKNPEASVQFMCFPVQIKNKYYPWIFFCVFSLMFRIVFDVLVGIIGGYLRNIYLDLLKVMKHTYITEAQAKVLEGYCGSGASGFILTDSCTEEDAVVGSSQNLPELVEPVVPFSGTGHRLGGETSTQLRNYQVFDEEKKP